MIDSSPSSAESSFRELDEAFLQTQTRIWIGEVLSIRLDEDLHISDLLQDGEILYEVSKVMWNLLLTKMELRHLKHKYGPFGSKKSSGRYRPYSNVDSFLKVCKILGLSGIDLFSPSDVVEKRDIRKVCICIRALSKKARSKQLSVPDFDMVIYSVAMPTDMVGVLRRSLESSQCTLSSSSYSSRNVSQTKLKQKSLYTPSNRDEDSSSSEDSDEAESRYMGDKSFADGLNSDQENSPETYPIPGQHRKQNVLELDITKEVKHEQCHGISHVKDEKGHNFGSGTTLENDDSVVGDSSCLNIGESNYISDYLAFSDLMVHATDGSKRVILDGENNMFDFFLNVDSQGHISDGRSYKNGSHRKFSDDEDMEVSSTTSMSSVLGRLLNLEFDDQFDEDDSSCANVFSSVSKENESEKRYKDSFVLSEPPKMDTFEAQLHAVVFDSPDALLSSKKHHSLLSKNKSELSGMDFLEDESCGTQTGIPDNDFCLGDRDMVVADNNQELFLSGVDKDSETDRTAMTGPDSDFLTCGDNHFTNDICSQISGEKISCNSKSVQESERSSKLVQTVNDRHFSIEESPSPCVSDDSSTVKDINRVQDNVSSATENVIQDIREQKLEIGTESTSDERTDKSPRVTHVKNSRSPLLKTVVKGTAIAGVLLLLMHIRKSRGKTRK